MSDTNEPSPRPWRIGENSLGWKSCIEDADGKQIASCWGGDGVNCTEPAQSDAALIVEAVNERDRLRDIVRRLTEYADAITGYRPRTVEVLSSEHPAWTFDGAALLREARAAIVEDAP